MTEKLRSLLDLRASAPTFDLPDLDAVRSAGLRRRRRSYAGATAAGLVATAAASALVVGLVAGGTDDSATPVATDPPAARTVELSWATGSVIHEAGRDIETGHVVRVYARTRVGFLTVDDAGRVFSVADGGVEQLGTTGDAPRLLTDPTSSRVVWSDEDGTGLVVHDLDAGTTTDVDLAGAELYAMDGDRVYARSGSQVVEVDLGTGEQRVVVTAAEDELGGFHADGGRTVTLTYGSTGALAEVGPAGGRPDSRFVVDGGGPLLSPDAAHLAISDDEGPVYDTATGDLMPPLDLRGFYEPYEWWDTTTLAVVTETAPGSQRARLSSCDVVTGACRTEVDDLGPFDQLEDFSLPVGER